MPWLRVGDTAALHPATMKVFHHEEYQDWSINELFGFILRCATLSAAFLTDYVVDVGTAHMIGGPRAALLLRQAIFAGYLTEATADGVPVYKLVDDPEYIHMRLEKEVKFERQRKLDSQNPALIVPVRVRDGDACRYCGLVVNWRARTGSRAGTYDHREPGQQATFKTYVVACAWCNQKRGASENADAEYPLLDEPIHPYYSDHTREWLARNDWANREGITLPPGDGTTVPPGQRPGNQPGARTTAARPTGDARTTAARPTGDARTGSAPSGAEQELPGTKSPRPVLPGAGRGGSGRVPQAEHSSAPRTTTSRRRRGKRSAGAAPPPSTPGRKT